MLQEVRGEGKGKGKGKLVGVTENILKSAVDKLKRAES